MSKKTTQCKCGNVIDLEPYRTADGRYELYHLRCLKCGASCTAFNGDTGEVTGWISARALQQANADYQRQLFDAECNEWYGRGNW